MSWSPGAKGASRAPLGPRSGNTCSCENCKKDRMLKEREESARNERVHVCEMDGI